jgi:hypothetical protein
MEGVAQDLSGRFEQLLTDDRLENPDSEDADPTAHIFDERGVELEKNNFSEGFDLRYLRKPCQKTLRISDEERRMCRGILSDRMFKQLHGKDAGKCWFCFRSVHPDHVHGDRHCEPGWQQRLEPLGEGVWIAFPETSECPWYQLYLAVHQWLRPEVPRTQKVTISMHSLGTTLAPPADVLDETRLDHADGIRSISTSIFSGPGEEDGMGLTFSIYSSPGQCKAQDI